MLDSCVYQMWIVIMAEVVMKRQGIVIVHRNGVGRIVNTRHMDLYVRMRMIVGKGIAIPGLDIVCVLGGTLGLGVVFRIILESRV